MKVKKINYVIGCDVPGCGQVANFVVEFGNNEKAHICSECAKKLCCELKRVTKNAN